MTVPGFKKFVRRGLAVQVAQTMRVDISLEIGSTAESVTVTEAATLLKTERKAPIAGSERLGELQRFTMEYLVIPTFTQHLGYAEVRRLLNHRGYAASRIDSQFASVEYWESLAADVSARLIRSLPASRSSNPKPIIECIAR